MKDRQYKIDVLTYYDNNQVRSDCGDITFYNNGSDPVTINSGVTLNPGQTFVLSANENEIDRTIYYFIFANTVANKKLTVLRKIYIT